MDARWIWVRRHLGSTIALVLGFLTFAAGVNALQGPKHNHADMLVGGPIMILGALAYRSAKKRKLGAANFSFTRQSLEIAAIALICVMILA